MDRRDLLRFLGFCALTGAITRSARAGVAYAVPLRALVQMSHYVISARPLAAESRWEEVFGARRIVTYTRVLTDEVLAGTSPAAELMVRTLGGAVGDIGQIVHGEALLRVGEACVLFLQPHEGVELVSEMAQGHYRFVQNGLGEARLAPSPHLPHLLRPTGATAANQLVGRSLKEARRIIAEAAR